MRNKLRYLLNRTSELLWIRPLIICLLSIILAFLASLADNSGIAPLLPNVTVESLDTLLSIIASSMLVIATFSVTAMISAYSSASNTATPRSFALVVADDVSQNALSAFIGSFIFSIVALIALQNDLYGNAGRFVLFSLTLLVFVIVIVTFIRWVDRVARLGRLEETINKAENATLKALKRRRLNPTMGANSVTPRTKMSKPVFTDRIGYVQQLDLQLMQTEAERQNVRFEVTALPGTFTGPGRVLGYLKPEKEMEGLDSDKFEAAFRIGKKRTFDDDPRFGLVVLSEIACRALSPGVNDPGTAISVIGTLVRLFSIWLTPPEEEDPKACTYDRVEVPILKLEDMYDDALSPMARDGAGAFELVTRLAKAYESLIWISDPEMGRITQKHARASLQRAQDALAPADLEKLNTLFKGLDTRP